MKYYRIYFENNKVDYAYSINQLKDIVGNNKVKRIELCLDNRILKTYKSLKNIKESDL